MLYDDGHQKYITLWRNFKTKQILSLALALALTLGCFLMAGCGKEDTIIVHTNAYFAPFEYSDGTEIVGVDVDIMNLVGEKLGKKVEFENTTFSVTLTMSLRGRSAMPAPRGSR